MSNNGTTIYRYNNHTFNLPSEASENDVRQALAARFPEITGATLITNPDGSKAFVVRAGTKG